MGFTTSALMCYLFGAHPLCEGRKRGQPQLCDGLDAHRLCVCVHMCLNV